MELGGNKTASTYFEKNNMMMPDGTPNHKAPALAKYKQDLLRKVEQAIGATIVKPQEPKIDKAQMDSLEKEKILNPKSVNDLVLG